MTSTPEWWGQLAFPHRVDQLQVTGLLRAVHGVSSPSRRQAIVFQAVARNNVISHYVGVPENRRVSVTAQLQSLVPGLVVTETDPPELPELQRAWRLWLSTSRRPLRTVEPELLSRTLLTALAGTGQGQTVVLQWLLGPLRHPLAVGSTHPDQLSESWPTALATAGVLGGKPVDAEARMALRLKQGEAGWRAIGRIAVHARDERAARARIGQLLGALRTAQGPGVTLGVRRISPTVVASARTPWFWGLALAVPEVTGLLAWPLGDAVADLPVQRRRAKLLPAPASIAKHGRVLAVEPTTDRPLALSVPDSLQHLHLLGPTGAGKSTVIINLIAQDMAAGRSIVVIEPKGDLVQDVLARVPENRLDDVVVLDPTDETPLGFNPLSTGPPELVADQVLSIFARLYADSWGPRLSQVLTASLMTLAKNQGLSLAALPLLLSDDGFRRRMVGRLDDPFGVSPFWANYERLSEGSRSQITAPVRNKIDPLLFRSSLRGVLGQAKPRFDLGDVFRKRRILLVDLAKGKLGPEAAKLLGTLLLHQLWQLALGRGSIPADRRRPVMVYVDEFQDYAALGDMAEILSQSRGLGVGWNLAHQYLAQLSPELRAGVLSQARSRLLFQLTHDDASILARGHRELTAEDFTELPAREVYLRLVTGSEVSRYISGRTLPPPEITSDPAKLRAASRARWGIPRAETDAALQALIDGPTKQTARPSEEPEGGAAEPPSGAIGVRRRPS